MNAKERLIRYLKSSKIGQTKFEEKVGISRGYINNNKGTIGTAILLKIKKTCPELNTDWLISGEGEMLKSQIHDEILPVPEDNYMMAEFKDLETAAGKLWTNGGGVDLLPENKRRLVPREYEKGNYLVVRVHGHSMDDGTKRSICEDEEVLIKQCFEKLDELPLRKKLFVINTKTGSVIKQITKIDNKNGVITCHSFNPLYPDYEVMAEDVIQWFTVEKKVKSKIIF